MPASELAIKVPHWVKRNPVVAGVVRRSLQLRTQEVKSFIFTATTGRSGTMTLSGLFATLPGCVALHEPYPIMNAEVLAAANEGDLGFVDRCYRRVKSINILRAAVGHRHYLEANHLFVKTFIGQAFAEFGARMAVVHLVRAPIEVAMSIYCLRQLPGTEMGNTWWLDHRAPTNVIRMADRLETDPELSHPFYKGLWYWYELEARFAAWRARLPGLRVVRFETPWFNDEARVLALLAELEVSYDRARVRAFVGRREHTKAEKKTLPLLQNAEAERMHDTFRRVLGELGHQPPVLAAV
ncbi:MAG TPA: hypothetical protein VHO06_25110 [Polyangia bacterium]|nr:hypothetical protein [Polyangia bacterium]